MIQTHIASRVVVKAALLALCNATFNDTDNQVTCGRAGGVDAVVRVVGSYYSENRWVVEVLAPALETLCNITANTDNEITCGQVGGVEVVVGLIKICGVQLLEQACAALHNITVHADNKARCRLAGGVQALVKVVERYQCDGRAGLLEHASGALKNIIADELE